MSDYPEYFNREAAAPVLDAAMSRYQRGKREGNSGEMAIAEKIMFIHGASVHQCQTPPRWMWEALSTSAKTGFKARRAIAWEELFEAGEIDE